MKNLNLLATVLTVLALSACSRENPDPVAPSGDVGYVRINLGQDDMSVTKADGDAELPSIDDFEIEIYNAGAVRLYRQPYSVAKDDLIRLNAGEFRLLAHHGDSLGAGFGKAYYLADQPFTVHGYVDNGEKYDEVSAVARLGNVRLSVAFGENFPKFYSDYWAVVRHVKYTKKQARFRKGETRSAYMPGGEIYLEVYARQSGVEAPDGTLKDTTVYYKSPAVAYEPNDAVTFRVNTGSLYGSLQVGIDVDRGVEEKEIDLSVPSEALPSRAPYFSYGGDTSGEYSYSYPAGLAGKTAGQYVNIDISPKTSFSSIVLHTESASLTLADVDLVQAGDAEKAALEAVGIDYLVPENYPVAYVDFSKAVEYLSSHAPFDAANPTVAVFTLTATDGLGRSTTGRYSVKATPVGASFSVEDVNIWGWKLVAPKARIQGVDEIPAGAVIGCQWSADGTVWSAEQPYSAVDGVQLSFPDLTGLPAGTDIRLRTIVNHDPSNVSEPTVIRTEEPQQVGNGDFEKYTAQKNVTPVALLSDFNVTWWQLYDNANDKWWAVNSLSRIPSSTQAAGYQDFKSYPSVALFTSGAYAGNSVMVGTIFLGSAASLLAAGEGALGELFIGTGNDEQGTDWAKASEGHAFSSRPSHLTVRYKFSPGGSTKDFVVSLQMLAADGSVIGTGSFQSHAAVNNWSLLTIPVNYTVTDKKAGSIRLSFLSSVDGKEDHQGLGGTKVTTLSGSHTIHVGNLLSLDNVTLLYE